MELLRRTIEQIGQQLDVLSKSQKIAIGLCAALVAGSLFWLVNYSTSPEMAPVLRQNLTLDEIDAALAALSAEGIPAKQLGNRIMVRPADQGRALMCMNRANALPTDTSVGFAELLADENPFRPADENQFRRLVALGTELGRILSSDDSVEIARVIIQDKSQRRVGALSNIKPTASVQVKMASGKTLDQARVDGICRFVSGAVPGLEPHNVTVRDAATGRAFAAVDPDDALGLGLLEEKKKNEMHLAEKIRDALQSIAGVLVSVSVDLDANKTTTQTQAWAKPEVKTEETLSSINTSASTPAETGVNANVGVALGGSGSGSSNSMDETKTEFFDQKPTEVTNTQKAPFAITRATASVSIPRSHFVQIYKSTKAEAAADLSKLDEDAEFQRIRDEEIQRVRSRVATILMAKSNEDVSVEEFYDFLPDGSGFSSAPGGAGTAMASTSGGMTEYARRYGVQAGLATLAMFSFFLLARMVRKSSELVRTALPPAPRTVDEEAYEETLSVSGGPVGRAATTEGLLIGQEVDEDTLRFSQLGEQVSKMVESNPASAAELLRRWATTGEK